MRLPELQVSRPHKIALAIVMLHVSAVLYLGIGIVGYYWLMDDEDSEMGFPIAVPLLIFCLLLVLGIEFVVFGLQRRKFWAWVTGACIFGMYLPSLFLPLGALGLWGLLDSWSRAEFGVGAESRA
jgi:hypothetical protein